VACASNGDIFCRECAVSNLLAQKKEIKRLEKEGERKKLEEADEESRADEEARDRAVEEFERVQMGLEVMVGKGRKVVGRENGKILVEEEEEGTGQARGTKRKFELDEDELLRIAKAERGKARKALKDEKVTIAILVLGRNRNVASIIDVPSERSLKVTTTFILGSILDTFFERQHYTTQFRKSSQALSSLSGVHRKITAQLFTENSSDCRTQYRDRRQIKRAGSNLP